MSIVRQGGEQRIGVWALLMLVCGIERAHTLRLAARLLRQGDGSDESVNSRLRGADAVTIGAVVRIPKQ